LDIDFDFSSEGKPVPALVGSDVGKDWLSHGEALRVNLSPQVAINFASHTPGKIAEFYRDGHPEISSFAALSGQTPQLQGAALTIVLLGYIYSAHHTICVSFFRYPSESFPLRAAVMVSGLIVVKIP
jgi:hypothetical protein